MLQEQRLIVTLSNDVFEPCPIVQFIQIWILCINSVNFMFFPIFNRDILPFAVNRFSVVIDESLHLFLYFFHTTDVHLLIFIGLFQQFDENCAHHKSKCLIIEAINPTCNFDQFSNHLIAVKR